MTKAQNDFSFIGRKEIITSSLIPRKRSKIAVTRNKKGKISASKTKNLEINSKLEKALNALDDCKDKYKEHQKTPPPSEGFRGIYSPENRLRSAPYDPGNTFMSSFYSPKTVSNFKSIQGNIPTSPVAGETKGDMKFTIDVNGIPHSVKMNPTDSTGKGEMNNN